MILADKMIHYIKEEKLDEEYLISINIPKEVAYQIPFVDSDGLEVTLSLSDFFDDLHEVIDVWAYHEVYYDKTFSEMSKITLEQILKTFNFPICDFWLTFIGNIKQEWALTLDTYSKL